MVIKILNQLIQLTPMQLTAINYYADHIDVSYYKERDNQFNEKRCRQQQRVGKAGEQAVANLHVMHNKPITQPDYEVYGPDEKNWNSDLYTGTNKIAVKSTDYASNMSWVFERNDKDIFYSDADIVTWFCFVENDQVTIEAWANKADIIPLMSDMRKSEYNATKRALYLKDLQWMAT